MEFSLGTPPAARFSPPLWKQKLQSLQVPIFLPSEQNSTFPRQTVEGSRDKLKVLSPPQGAGGTKGCDTMGQWAPQMQQSLCIPGVGIQCCVGLLLGWF